MNQTLPKSNPVKEVGKNQRLRTVGFRIARAVGVLTPQSFPRTIYIYIHVSTYMCIICVSDECEMTKMENGHVSSLKALEKKVF